MRILLSTALVGLCLISGPMAWAEDPIVHDGEYYFLARQHAERWAEEDRAIDEKLAAIRDWPRRQGLRGHGGQAVIRPACPLTIPSALD